MSLSSPSLFNPKDSQSPPKTVRVSIIIPVYNEYYHIEDVLKRVANAPMPSFVKKELIVVDDGSTDGTTEVLKNLKADEIKVFHSPQNIGKGAAIREGLKLATGDVVVIQDGDQEYNPAELENLIVPILNGKATVVYGSRFLGKIEGMYFRYWLVNKLLVLAVWVLYGAKISDEATAYKAFSGNVIRSLPLSCQRFEFCPEVTAKVLRRGHQIYEVPITYSARNVEQGKKIRFWDAVEAFTTLIRYRFWS